MKMSKNVVAIMLCCLPVHTAKTARQLRKFLHDSETYARKKKSVDVLAAVPMVHCGEIEQRGSKQLQKNDTCMQVQQGLMQERDKAATKLKHEKEQRHVVERDKNTLEQKLAHAQAHIESLNQECAEKNKKVANLEHVLQQERTEHDAITVKLAKAEKERSELEQDIEQKYLDKCATLNQEKDRALLKVKNGSEKQQKLVSTLMLKEQELQEKNKEIASLNYQITKNSDRIFHLEHHVRELNKAVFAEKEHKGSYKEQIKKLAMENDELRLAHHQLSKKYNAEINDLKIELARMQVDEEIAEQLTIKMASQN